MPWRIVSNIAPSCRFIRAIPMSETWYLQLSLVRTRMQSKGFSVQKPEDVWKMPTYLPIDPADLGVALRLGDSHQQPVPKGRVAYLLESPVSAWPCRADCKSSFLPKCSAMHGYAHGGEMEAADIWALFSAAYLDAATPLGYVGHHLFEDGKGAGHWNLNQFCKLCLDVILQEKIIWMERVIQEK